MALCANRLEIALLLAEKGASIDQTSVATETQVFSSDSVPGSAFAVLTAWDNQLVQQLKCQSSVMKSKRNPYAKAGLLQCVFEIGFGIFCDSFHAIWQHMRLCNLQWSCFLDYEWKQVPNTSDLIGAKSLIDVTQLNQLCILYRQCTVCLFLSMLLWSFLPICFEQL